jgi:hypothetical protein
MEQIPYFIYKSWLASRVLEEFKVWMLVRRGVDFRDGETKR